MAGTPARRAKVRRILVIITLATLPLYCLGYIVLQRTQAQLKLNFSTPTRSSTGVETLQVFVPATQAPGVAATLPAQALTSTLSPAAEDFIREYFQLIGQRAYTQTWAMLSTHYRQLHNPTGYQPYVDFWNTVQSVDVVTIQPVTQNQQSARLLVQLAFYFTNGKPSIQVITFNLVADTASDSWLIDDTY
jgi:hypothetical protein